MTVEDPRIDELLCFAHRTGDQVAVQLRLTTAWEGDATVARLTANDRRIEVPAAVRHEGDHVDVTFTVPQHGLRRAAWRISLKTPDSGRFRPLQARLLARPDQPVALLLGPAPTTRMAPPPPRRHVSTVRRAAQRLPRPVKQLLRGARDRLDGKQGTRAPAA
jgi:hypothetical protein